MIATPYGFRIVGTCQEERRLVDHAGAFLGYATCDERAQVEREAYLSAFVFGDDFRELLQSTGSVKGFDGACWSPWLWFDIDRTDLDAAQRDARRLAHCLGERYRLDEDALLIFFSGSKGFHLGLPTALWAAEPSTSFHCICRRLAEGIGESGCVVIDKGVYDQVRPFRAPNSRHQKTGLHKRRLSFDELQGLSLDAVRKLATKPAPFDLPEVPPACNQAKDDWRAAAELVCQASQAKSKRKVIGNGMPTLNRLTVEFIRNGADEGDRHRVLYSAARNLGEFGCPPALAEALLTDAGLDCGLAPKDVHRQIECGLTDQGPPPAVQAPLSAPVVNAADMDKQLAALWLGATPPSAMQQPTHSSVPVSDAGRVQEQLAALWQSPVPPPPGEPAPEQADGEQHGDAKGHPLDRLGADAEPHHKKGEQL